MQLQECLDFNYVVVVSNLIDAVDVALKDSRNDKTAILELFYLRVKKCYGKK